LTKKASTGCLAPLHDIHGSVEQLSKLDWQYISPRMTRSADKKMLTLQETLAVPVWPEETFWSPPAGEKHQEVSIDVAKDAAQDADAR
jgi:hypothetical protein